MSITDMEMVFTIDLTTQQYAALQTALAVAQPYVEPSMRRRMDDLQHTIVHNFRVDFKAQEADDAE